MAWVSYVPKKARKAFPEVAPLNFLAMRESGTWVSLKEHACCVFKVYHNLVVLRLEVLW